MRSAVKSHGTNGKSTINRETTGPYTTFVVRVHGDRAASAPAKYQAEECLESYLHEHLRAAHGWTAADIRGLTLRRLRMVHEIEHYEIVEAALYVFMRSVSASLHTTSKVTESHS
jgi:hypothetical protein